RESWSCRPNDPAASASPTRITFHTAAPCSLTCPFEDYQDLAQVGLLEAARFFDEREGILFAHWAAFCIRHAVIDGVPEWDDLPRGARRQLRALEGADLMPRKGGGEATSPSEVLADRLSLMVTGVALMIVGEAPASMTSVAPTPEGRRAPASTSGPVSPLNLETNVDAVTSQNSTAPPHVQRALRAAGRPSGGPEERFHKGELDRQGYVEAMIEQALGSLWPLTRGEVELVRRTLRCLIELNPALAELVERATSSPRRPSRLE